MAAANTILVLETLIIVAMAVVWCVHLWASEDFKKRLTVIRHRVFHNVFDGHHHIG
jgi:hypothetical protein